MGDWLRVICGKIGDCRAAAWTGVVNSRWRFASGRPYYPLDVLLENVNVVRFRSARSSAYDLATAKRIVVSRVWSSTTRPPASSLTSIGRCPFARAKRETR